MIELEDYLAYVFGEDNMHEDEVPHAIMPYLFTTFSYESFRIYDQQYVFLHWTDIMPLYQYDGVRKRMEKAFGCPLALVVEKTFAEQVKQFIKLGITFVEPGRQIYMPMNKRITDKHIIGKCVMQDAGETMHAGRIAAFTPQTQVCALYFLYAADMPHTVNEIIERTGMNCMAASRALKVLVSAGAVQRERVKRESAKSERVNGGTGYSICGSREDFYTCIENCLINPVRKEVYIREKDLPEGCVLAGYSALSRWTSLPDTGKPAYAIYSRLYDKAQVKAETAASALVYKGDYVRLQVWKYSPALLADTPGYADKVSVWLSLADLDEEADSAVRDLKRQVLQH